MKKVFAFVLSMLMIVLLLFSVVGCKKAEEGEQKMVYAPAPAPIPAHDSAKGARPAEKETPLPPKWTEYEEAAKISMPDFQWPPPKASASREIPRDCLVAFNNAHPTYAEVDQHLRAALETTGYTEKSYFGVPEGYAMVTRLEQINADGSSKPMPDRWAVEVAPLRKFTLASYMRALFTAPNGYFRIIVFIVTPQPFTQSGEVSRKEALSWLSEGTNKLPEEVGRRELLSSTSCTALIYEFEKPASDGETRLLVPGLHDGQTHLEKSGLWSNLRR